MAKSKKSAVRRMGDRTRDLTRAVARPTPDHARLTQSRALTWMVRLVGATVAVAAMMSLFVFPIREYITQAETLERKRAEFDALADANEQLQNEVNQLATPEGTRNAARSELGYVLPGEERLSLTPMPALPTTLPDAWPYSMVTDIVELRAQLNLQSRAPLAPLGP